MQSAALVLCLAACLMGTASGFSLPAGLIKAYAGRGRTLGLCMAEGDTQSKIKANIDRKFYNSQAPFIYLFSELGGCNRDSKEYQGKKSGDYNDALCLKVMMYDVKWSKDEARTLLFELLPTLSPANRKARGYWKETDE